MTTDSQTSEEDPTIPPTLPPKHGRDSDCGLNSLEESLYSHARISSGSTYHFSNRPLPATPENHHQSDGHYEILEITNREVIQSIDMKMGKKSAPVPPPKPSRTSKNHAMSP